MEALAWSQLYREGLTNPGSSTLVYRWKCEKRFGELSRPRSQLADGRIYSNKRVENLMILMMAPEAAHIGRVS